MASILVVDDDEIVRDTLYDLFSDEHRCHAAKTAEQALEWLDKEFYDVVITDISMPGLSGLELMGHVRQRFPETPVIIISGITDEEHARGLMNLGAFRYIIKPFRIEAIEETVKRAIALPEKPVSTTEEKAEGEGWSLAGLEKSRDRET